MNVQPMASVTFSDKKVLALNLNRKRSAQPHLWRDQVAKFRRNTGQPYISRKKVFVTGKLPSTTVKVCGGRCNHNGCTMPLNEKTQLFQAYHAKGKWDIQRTFRMGLIDRVINQNGSNSFRYFVSVVGVRMEICKKTFMDVFQISTGIVKTVLGRMIQGQIVIRDGRGQHDNHPTTAQAVILDMHQHINSFPKYENHYSRAKLGDFFLSSDLTLTQMFRQFILGHQHIQNVAGMMTKYTEVFKESGLHIGMPKSDTCKECDRLNVNRESATILQDRLLVVEERSIHLGITNSGYEEMRLDIETSRVDPNHVVLCGDLQQVLFSPTLTYSDMFYKRQFSTYNYCIHNGSTGQGHMTVWHEHEGHRGVNEVVSTLHRYVTATFMPLHQGQTRTLSFWSDRCRGQTNNYMMLVYFKYLISMGYFTIINQKFMYTGHSFMPCDRLFALIEKKKKTAKVNVPEDWVQIIRNSCITNPFEIHRLRQTEIFDIKRLCASVPKPAALKVTESMWFRMTSEEPHVILTRNGYGATPIAWKEIVLRAPNQRGRIRNRRLWTANFLRNAVLHPVYQGLLPIAPEKRADLISMLPMLLPQYRPFYNNLT